MKVITTSYAPIVLQSKPFYKFVLHRACTYDIIHIYVCVAAARGVVERAKERRIRVQVQPDGQQPLELARTNSLHYSIFNLEALVRLAIIGAF